MPIMAYIDVSYAIICRCFCTAIAHDNPLSYVLMLLMLRDDTASCSALSHAAHGRAMACHQPVGYWVLGLACHTE